jgi:peptide subunit release factor RF-3
VPTTLERQPISQARWVSGDEDSILKMAIRSSVFLCRDAEQNSVALFREAFYLNWTIEKFPELKFMKKV